MVGAYYKPDGATEAVLWTEELAAARRAQLAEEGALPAEVSAAEAVADVVAVTEATPPEAAAVEDSPAPEGEDEAPVRENKLKAKLQQQQREYVESGAAERDRLEYEARLAREAEEKAAREAARAERAALAEQAEQDDRKEHSNQPEVLGEDVELEEGPQTSVDLEVFKDRIARSRLLDDTLPLPGDPDSYPEIKSFTDIFAVFPIGGPEGFYVQIERRMPKIYRGVSIFGMQRPLYITVDLQGFGARYGSGSYMATVYGPTKNGRRGADGSVIMKSYSKTIRVDVPDPFGENPPNPEMAEVVEGTTMLDEGRIRRLGTTTEADARMHEASLEHEIRREEMLERRRASAEAREQRAREAEEQRETQGLGEALRLVRDQSKQIADISRGTGSGIDATTVFRTTLEAQQVSAAQLESARNHHAQELSALRESNSRALESARIQAQADADRQRSEANDRVRSMEAAHHRELSDERERSRRDLEALRQDYERRMADLTRHHETRMSDERRQHDRDLAARSEINQTNSSTTMQLFESRIQAKEDEIRRIQSELDKTRHELEAEKSKDLATRISEAERVAEALGFERASGEGEKSWQEMLGEVAMGVVQRSPEIAASVASIVRPQAAPSPARQYVQQAQPGFPQGSQPFISPAFAPAFASEDVDVDFPANPAAPIGLGEDPFNRGLVMQPSNEPWQQPQVQMVQQPMHMQPQMMQQPVQQRAPSPPAQAPVSSQPGMVTDAQILQFSQGFREAFEEEREPAEFAEEIASTLGPMLKPVLGVLSVERVTDVLSAAEGAEDDPLLRRDGQKYLAALWVELQEVAK